MSADLQILAHRITAVGVLLGQVRALIDDGKSADAKNLIKAGQAQLVEIARDQRQEHDRLSHLAPVRGDEALMADLQAARADCFRDHRHRDHTPTGDLPRMKPIEHRDVAPADARPRDGRRFLAPGSRWAAFRWSATALMFGWSATALMFGGGVVAAVRALVNL